MEESEGTVSLLETRIRSLWVSLLVDYNNT